MRLVMRQRLRLGQMSAAAGGALIALGPALEALARRRKRRNNREDDDRDDDDDDKGGRTLRDLAERRRQRAERRNDDDQDVDAKHRLGDARHRANAADDGNDDDGGGHTVSARQGLNVDLDINRLVQDRIDTALDGDGDHDDEPNIIVGRDGDALTVLTRGIAFAQDSQGIAVETGGISYDSGANADFES